MKNQIKLIVFDAYGVCLSKGYPNTSKFLAKKYHSDPRRVQSILYTKYFSLAAIKKISQKEAWQKAVKELGLPLSVAQIKSIHYGLMKASPEVLEVAQRLKKNYTIALLSKNTREQFGDIKKQFPGLRKTFGKNLINAWEYGLPKAGKETVNFICKRFNVKPKEIVYIDDQTDNLKAPKAMGVNTIFYKNFSRFTREIGQFIQ